MNPTNPLFQILHRNAARPNKSVTLPSGASSAGIAYVEDTPAADQDGSRLVKLADGVRPFSGFITRDVIVGTPTPEFAELAASGDAPDLPMESAFSGGGEGSLEDADEYEAEGPTYISSGNGAQDILPGTAVGTKCSFLNGKTCKAASGQVAEYELAEQLVPAVAGNVRCRFRRLAGVTLP
jgi:hypothetical protein